MTFLNVHDVSDVRRTEDHIIEHEGVRYVYHTWSDDWMLFDTHEQFKLWAENDVQNNNGGYADEVHNIEPEVDA